MLKIGVLVSGGGTNLQAILDRMEQGRLPECEIVTVISSRPGAYAMERAANHGVPSVCLARKDYGSIEEYDAALLRHLRANQVDLVVLAGFLTLLGSTFLESYRNRVINVHPSLIPSFCGKGYYGLIPHQEALRYGVKVTGATVHFVELEADAGPIILQKAVDIREEDTPETLQQRVMKEAEWEILPEAIRLIAAGRVRVEGRVVRILPESSACGTAGCLER